MLEVEVLKVGNQEVEWENAGVRGQTMVKGL